MAIYCILLYVLLSHLFVKACSPVCRPLPHHVVDNVGNICSFGFMRNTITPFAEFMCLVIRAHCKLVVPVYAHFIDDELEN